MNDIESVPDSRSAEPARQIWLAARARHQSARFPHCGVGGVQRFPKQALTFRRRFHHRPQIRYEVVKRWIDAGERYRAYRTVAVLIDIQAPGTGFKFTISHQLVNDVTRVSNGMIGVSEIDARFIFDFAASVQ